MREGRWLRAHLAVVYLFLYVPIAVLIGLSFNRSGLPTAWGGFSTRWYGEMLDNEALTAGLRASLIVALGTTVMATVLGTLLAVGLERHVRSSLVEAYVLAPAILPDLVLAIGLLAFYTLLDVTLGLRSVLLSHVLFALAFVATVVRTRLHNLDRSTEDAARDLGDTAVGAFVRITLPALAPGIAAGALLAFTLSFDEFVIAFFTNGPSDPTLPTVIYSSVRFGVTPDVNALAAVVLVVSATAVLAAQRLSHAADALR
jgi:spermidine/putrescine transport system permease protein